MIVSEGRQGQLPIRYRTLARWAWTAARKIERAIHSILAVVTLHLVFRLAAREPNVWDRVNLNYLLEEPVEERAVCLGASAIEPKRELV